MYTAKYLIYVYILITFSLLMLSFILTLIIISMKSKNQSKIPIINITFDNISKEVYSALKIVGITLTKEQQRAFESNVKENHKEMGFKI